MPGAAKKAEELGEIMRAHLEEFQKGDVEIIESDEFKELLDTMHLNPMEASLARMAAVGYHLQNWKPGMKRLNISVDKGLAELLDQTLADLRVESGISGLGEFGETGPLTMMDAIPEGEMEEEAEKLREAANALASDIGKIDIHAPETGFRDRVLFVRHPYDRLEEANASVLSPELPDVTSVGILILNPLLSGGFRLDLHFTRWGLKSLVFLPEVRETWAWLKELVDSKTLAVLPPDVDVARTYIATREEAPPMLLSLEGHLSIPMAATALLTAASLRED